MTVLPYRDHGYVRILSTRTGEVLFKIKMLGGAMIVWGSHYRPSEFDARLDVRAPYSVEMGELPPDYDPSW